MSNVEAIRFLINEANQLTADTPKKVRKHTIDLLAKAVREVAGPSVKVNSDIWISENGQVSWHMNCSNPSGIPHVALADKHHSVVDSWVTASASWDNAAEIFVKAIDILAEGGSPHIPAIRESLKVTNTPKVDPPKFDPKQAIWDAGGWSVSEDGSVSIVGECAKAYVEYGKMGYIAERHPDREMVISVIGPIQNPRHVDTDRYRVIAVLPNRVYVAKKNGTDSWVVFTKDSRTSDTTIYYHYDSAVKDAIKFSQETS